MVEKKDGVVDGWILYEGWCKRNGGTPIRGIDSASHICFVGPLPENTIDPGDDGTVDIITPGSGIRSRLLEEMVALEVRAAELRLDQAKLDFNITTERIKSL